MIVSLLPAAPLFVDHSHHTLRPQFPEGDEHFGLSLGSNGEGPSMRRHIAEIECHAQGYTWLRHDGRVATGPTLRGSTDSEAANQWGLR